jgi:GTPase-associated protein 1, N-terminal domain type 1
VEFKLQQALFGYDGGHQLLAASVRLPTEAKHFLSVATDSSGSAPLSGFDQVHCGMPLTGTDFYALFSTWLAPEMPRPGCVWSHVLLIELADLAQLIDLGELRQLFRRPKKIDEQTWRNPLSFFPQRITAAPIAPFREADCLQILEVLYATPETPALVEAPTAETYEDLVFAVWSQQWPRLRRSFRFSTGSFGDRGRGGQPFDLQVTPLGNRRAWQRGGEEKRADTTHSASEGSEQTRQYWLKVAANDLCAPAVQGLRSFLQTYGLDVSDPRTAFARLATAYNLVVLRPSGDWKERLSSLGRIFPDQSEALRLKESLVAPRQSSDPQESLEHAWATASFLLDSPDARPYASVSFDFADLAPSLWKGKSEGVLSLLSRLVRQPENPAATSFAAAIANAVQPSELKLIADQRSELIPIILNHRPALAFDASTWQLPEHTQWQITEVLDRLPLSQKQWGDVMAAKFLSATYVAVRESVEKAGPYAMQGAFRWFESAIAKELLPSQIWREALATPAAERLAGPGALPPAELALCAWFPPPETIRQVLTASRDDVQQLAQQPLDLLPHPLRLPTAFLLVTLGLRAAGSEGVKPLVRGYYEVYNALAVSTASNIAFPWESWLLLSAELPQPGRWRTWDRCQRLRRATRDWLHVHMGTGKPLLDEAPSEKHHEIARRTLAEDNSTDNFID